MAAREGFTRIRKVLVVISILWAVACAAMFQSMADHSSGVALFFLIVAALPVAAAWGLLWVIEGFIVK